MTDTTQLKQYYDAATPGPWCVDDHVVRPGDSPGMWHVYQAEEDDGPLLSTSLGSEADVRFIAAAHNAMPALLAEINELRERVKAKDIALETDEGTKNMTDTIRLRCYHCGKSVSTPVPASTIVRAVLECPECSEQQSSSIDVPSSGS